MQFKCFLDQLYFFLRVINKYPTMQIKCILNSVSTHAERYQQDYDYSNLHANKHANLGETYGNTLQEYQLFSLSTSADYKDNLSCI